MGVIEQVVVPFVASIPLFAREIINKSIMFLRVKRRFVVHLLVLSRLVVDYEGSLPQMGWTLIRFHVPFAALAEGFAVGLVGIVVEGQVVHVRLH